MITAEEVAAIVGLPAHPTIGDRSTAPCGKHYDEVCSSGVRHHRDVLYFHEHPARALYDTADEAIEAYKTTVRKYADGKIGKLYWRHEPDLDRVGGRFRVYSRLVIA